MVSSTRRLADVHRLEAALERGVLLDVLAVLVERGRADHAQLAAGQHRLEHVAGVHRALGRARADDGVQLVDEGDDLAVGVGDLLEHRLEALLELAAVLGAGDHRARSSEMRRLFFRLSGTSPSTMRRARPSTMAVLPTPGLADEHGVVLGAPGEHLDDAADLVVAADDRVELALGGPPAVRSRPYFSSAWNCSSGFWLVTRWLPRTSRSAASSSSRVTPRRSAMASSRCSVERYSSLQLLARRRRPGRAAVAQLAADAGLGAAVGLGQLGRRPRRPGCAA